MIPTATPAPVGPSARASGPLMTSSPCESAEPVCTRRNGVLIALARPSAAASAIASGGR